MRSLVLITLLASVGVTARAASDDETPQPPPPPPVEPIEAHLSLSAVLRIPSGFGAELAIYPVERLELGVQLASCLFVSEASAYLRYVVLQDGPHGLNVGVRAHAIVSLFEGDDDQPVPVHRQISVELGYEHRAGASLFGVEIGGAVWDDDVWFPRDWTTITGEIRLGHVW